MMEEIKNFESSVNLKETQTMLQMTEAEDLKAAVTKFYTDRMQPLIEKVSNELESVLGQPWIDLKNQINGIFAAQVIFVLWHAINDPLYKELDEK